MPNPAEELIARITALPADEKIANPALAGLIEALTPIAAQPAIDHNNAALLAAIAAASGSDLKDTAPATSKSALLHHSTFTNPAVTGSLKAILNDLITFAELIPHRSKLAHALDEFFYTLGQEYKAHDFHNEKFFLAAFAQDDFRSEHTRIFNFTQDDAKQDPLVLAPLYRPLQTSDFANLRMLVCKVNEFDAPDPLVVTTRDGVTSYFHSAADNSVDKQPHPRDTDISIRESEFRDITGTFTLQGQAYPLLRLEAFNQMLDDLQKKLLSPQGTPSPNA